ncbi:MAG: hypothetical protein M1322_01940 [Candidatus Parvarchaeota archaeon]|jgi:hypothetical protein|nr:hypothetical protein [Candidatus Parvarchaeota archaeon]MCL5106857.1 hypothetical protein [Candidatus Parvarchaeota archaeon]
MGRKEKLEKILKDLSVSFKKSKLLEYMDFGPQNFVFKPEKANINGKVVYNALASYDLEKDKFYLLKELFNPGPLDNEQKIQSLESQKALIMHEEVHRAVIKSGLLEKYNNDPVISSTFYLDKYHSLPFVLASLKFNGTISNYFYIDGELEDFTSAFSSSSKLVEYLMAQNPASIKESLYLLDLTNLKESAKETALKLHSTGLSFRDGTMFAISSKEALVYFKKAFYTAKLNDTTSNMSITYKKLDLL